MIKNYFKLEEYREKCAEMNDDAAFLATYSNPKLPEIVNENTPQEWESRLEDIPEAEDPMTHDRIHNTAKLIATVPKASSIIDIGIGNGWVEQILHAKYPKKFSFTGLDITPKNIEKLKKALPGIFVSGDIRSVPKSISSKKYDVLLLLEVIEHISPKETFRALKQCRSLLKKNGHLILSTPVYEDLEDKIKEGRNVSKHVRRYTPAIILKELEHSGFHVQNIKYFYAFSRNYKLKSLIARLTGIRRPNVVLIDATIS